MRRVVLLGFDGFQGLDLVGPLEVLDAAGRVAARDVTRQDTYRLQIASRDGGPIRSHAGLRVMADVALPKLRGPIDTLIVVGGPGVQTHREDAALVRGLARLAGRARRVASVCTGAWLLAEAGLLDGRRATTHWAACDDLAARFPEVRLEADRLFVEDGPVWTSAGVTAGMDLALAFVERDLGRDVALATARWLVMFVQRSGGQSQFSAQLSAQLAERDVLRELQAWIAEHPEADLSVPTLARRAAMSPRHFARVFRAQVGQTPAEYVERTRVEVARRLLERTGLDLGEVAAACGLVSPPRLRRAFVRQLGVAPSDYRARFRALAEPTELPWKSSSSSSTASPRST